MTNDDKRCAVYLLTGNCGQDLFEELWKHVSEEYKQSLLKDVKVYEDDWNKENLAAGEPPVNLVEIYDSTNGTNDRFIWG